MIYIIRILIDLHYFTFTVPERNQGPIGPSDSTGVLPQGPKDSANDGEDEDDLPLTMLGTKHSYLQFDYCFKPQIRRIAQINHKKKRKKRNV